MQEYLAKRKLDRLALLNAPTTRVVRDGEVAVVPTTEVVQDDLIELRTGDEVPADGTLLTSSAGLELDEANLTGESDPVPHGAGDEIMSGTSVVAGSGRYHARQVGADAYVNRIAADARKFTRTRSEIQYVDQHPADATSPGSSPSPCRIADLVAVAHVVGDQGWQEVVLRSAAGVVGLVPEGLVLLTSVAFLLAGGPADAGNVLVQQLPAVEGLARVDVVCLDKTGTLTVGEIAFDDVTAVAWLRTRTRSVVRWARSPTTPTPTARWPRSGRRSSRPAGSRTRTVPFNSARKWSAACFEEHETWVLGAPEVLLAGRRSRCATSVAELARRGRRVVLLARSAEHLDEPVAPGATSPRLRSSP